jgi:hypothetical protein
VLTMIEHPQSIIPTFGCPHKYSSQCSDGWSIIFATCAAKRCQTVGISGTYKDVLTTRLPRVIGMHGASCSATQDGTLGKA